MGHSRKGDWGITCLAIQTVQLSWHRAFVGPVEFLILLIASLAHQDAFVLVSSITTITTSSTTMTATCLGLGGPLQVMLFMLAAAHSYQAPTVF